MKTEFQEFPETGLLRIDGVLKFIPVSRSELWAGIKTGKYPVPQKLSKRVTVWRAADIRKFCDGDHNAYLGAS